MNDNSSVDYYDIDFLNISLKIPKIAPESETEIKKIALKNLIFENNDDIQLENSYEPFKAYSNSKYM